MRYTTGTGTGRRPIALVLAALLLAGALGSVRAEEPGEEIMKARCGKCHAPPPPEKLTAEQWPAQLEIMGRRAGLSKNEKSQLLAFLQEHSKRAAVVVSMAEERRVFEEKCSLCHSPDRVFLEPLTPESRRHIVKRMRERAPEGWISEEEAHEILEYLSLGAPETKKPVRKEVKEGGPAAVFRERCATCHTLERVYLELEESKEKGKAPPWMHIVKRMREKAPDWISAEEAAQIVKYLGTLKTVEKK